MDFEPSIPNLGGWCPIRTERREKLGQEGIYGKKCVPVFAKICAQVNVHE